MRCFFLHDMAWAFANVTFKTFHRLQVSMKRPMVYLLLVRCFFLHRPFIGFFYLLLAKKWNGLR